MTDSKYNIVRDEMLTIYDINPDFLRNVDYNKIKKGYISDIEKILYIFICDDKYVLNDIYKGDSVMDKIMEDFDMITRERDEVLFYDPEDLNRQIIEEKVEEEIEKRLKEIAEETAKETAKKIKNLNISLEKISIATGLSIEELKKI